MNININKENNILNKKIVLNLHIHINEPAFNLLILYFRIVHRIDYYFY